MEELLQRLQSIHGLSADQSSGILNTITGYIKEKFPMVGGALDSFLPTGSTPANTQVTATNAAPASITDAAPAQGGGDILDKISGMIPGGAGEKLEQFAKDKLGGLFGGNKTA